MFRCALISYALPLICVAAIAQDAPNAERPQLDTSRGDRMIAEYFRRETAKLQENCLAEIQTLDDWNAKRSEYRRQLLEMLGLDPLPERTDLKPVITGTVEADEFVVEKLHFQSRPGLYVAGNLYRPKKVDQPLPAILYVCGHGRVVNKDGESLGNKTHYQHHGAWFARNGYVCLTIDSLQLGEIEGIHHGTHRYGMWWWLGRGYTPAGVECWNCMRALDYLETRPEVDKTRFGVTGRSGGGAYSWWIAATDERIKCAVPVAGITDLQNHVVDGCVEGHCDCMFMVNTYRWDYPLVAALVAPRPLLISNTDSDGIFPLDGVVRTFDEARRIYRLYDETEKGTSAKVALNITAGPHKDTQELQVHAFRWLNHYLKDDDSLVEDTAVKFFEPEQLKVFDKLPEDQINTEIQESFVARAAPADVPADKAAWETMRDGWLTALREKTFRGLPAADSPLLGGTPTAHPPAKELWSVEKDGVRFAAYEFTSQEPFALRLYVLHRTGLQSPELSVLNFLDDQGWQEFLADIRPAFEAELKDEQLPPADAEGWADMKQMFASFPWEMTYVCPRGVGPTAWDQSEKKQVQYRRRFYLLGQTLEEMQMYDVRRAIETVQAVPGLEKTPLWLQSHRTMAGITLYASLFESSLFKPDIKRLDLYELPKTNRDGPTLFNVSRYFDMPQVVAMAAERSKIVIYQDEEGWDYPQSVAEKLGWDAKQVQIRKRPK
ncbi:MAG TPA: prolyl oligopeptidase family serine peptidase [Pirellulaceae bacterium]|nr:prolyl oligopeptidase family serine peptidase [Pirellulaceae bacterium]